MCHLNLREGKLDRKGDSVELSLTLRQIKRKARYELTYPVGNHMRHLLLTAMALLAVLAFSNFGTTGAEAGKRHHKPALKNHHLKTPGRAGHHIRHRKYARHRRYKRHVRSSFRKSHRSRYRVIHTTRRAHGVNRNKRQHRGYRDHGHAVHHRRHAGGKYRNRTQFCRRNWERHHGRKVIVRRCVWVHNSKLHRYQGH